MQTRDIIDALDATGYAWTIAKGRVRTDEPAWAVGLYPVDEQGLHSPEAVFMTEGDDLSYCVIRAQVFAHQHRSDNANGVAVQAPTAPGASAPDATEGSQRQC